MKVVGGDTNDGVGIHVQVRTLETVEEDNEFEGIAGLFLSSLVGVLTDKCF
jgi:hypothetical protein